MHRPPRLEIPLLRPSIILQELDRTAQVQQMGQAQPDTMAQPQLVAQMQSTTNGTNDTSLEQQSTSTGCFIANYNQELQQHDTMAQLANNQLTGQQNNQQYFAQIITADVVPITEQQQHMDTTFEQQSTLDNARSANNQGFITPSRQHFAMEVLSAANPAEREGVPNHTLVQNGQMAQLPTNQPARPPTVYLVRHVALQLPNGSCGQQENRVPADNMQLQHDAMAQSRSSRPLPVPIQPRLRIESSGQQSTQSADYSVENHNLLLQQDSGSNAQFTNADLPPVLPKRKVLKRGNVSKQKSTSNTVEPPPAEYKPSIESRVLKRPAAQRDESAPKKVPGPRSKRQRAMMAQGQPICPRQPTDPSCGQQQSTSSAACPIVYVNQHLQPGDTTAQSSSNAQLLSKLRNQSSDQQSTSTACLADNNAPPTAPKQQQEQQQEETTLAECWPCCIIREDEKKNICCVCWANKQEQEGVTIREADWFNGNVCHKCYMFIYHKLARNHADSMHIIKEIMKNGCNQSCPYMELPIEELHEICRTNPTKRASFAKISNACTCCALKLFVHVGLDITLKKNYTTRKWQAEIRNEENLDVARKISASNARTNTFVFSVESEMHGIDVKVTANYKELSDEISSKQQHFIHEHDKKDIALASLWMYRYAFNCLHEQLMKLPVVIAFCPLEEQRIAGIKAIAHTLVTQLRLANNKPPNQTIKETFSLREWPNDQLVEQRYLNFLEVSPLTQTPYNGIECKKLRSHPGYASFCIEEFTKRLSHDYHDRERYKDGILYGPKGRCHSEWLRRRMTEVVTRCISPATDEEAAANIKFDGMVIFFDQKPIMATLYKLLEPTPGTRYQKKTLRFCENFIVIGTGDRMLELEIRKKVLGYRVFSENCGVKIVEFTTPKDHDVNRKTEKEEEYKGGCDYRWLNRIGGFKYDPYVVSEQEEYAYNGYSYQRPTM